MLCIILAQFSIDFFVEYLSKEDIRLKKKAINQGDINVEK